jgi:hypothetical protein
MSTPTVTMVDDIVVKIEYPLLPKDTPRLPYSNYTGGKKISWKLVDDIAVGTFTIDGQDVTLIDPNKELGFTSLKQNFKMSCQCKNVEFYAPLPKEIARCHCSVCRDLNGTKYSSFAQYPQEVLPINLDVNVILTSRASRGYCSKCKTNIYMKYNDSKKIWLADIFQFDCSTIPTYDIYRE